MIPKGTIVKLLRGYIGRVYWGVVIGHADGGILCAWKRTRTEAIEEYRRIIAGKSFNENDNSVIEEKYVEIKQPVTNLVSWKEMIK